MTQSLPSSWAFGPYRNGQGVEGDPPRLMYAIAAIKAELNYLGAVLNLDITRFGPKTEKAVKDFQFAVGLEPDGRVGRLTANALWRERIEAVESDFEIPKHWLRAQIHWESGDDPGAELLNTDGSYDRGLIQLNSRNQSDPALTFDPTWSIPFLGGFLARGAHDRRNCETNKWMLAVGSWRTPVGASEWCDHPELEPKRVADGGTWGEQAVYYVDKVNTTGRLGWVG